MSNSRTEEPRNGNKAMRRETTDELRDQRDQLEDQVKASLVAADEHESRFRAVFEYAPDAIALADVATGSIIMANRALEELVGHNREELVGLPFTVLHPEDSRPEMSERFRMAAKEQAAFHREVPLLHKDGTRFYCTVTTALVELGGAGAVIGFFRDVTEQRANRMALKESRSQLAQAQTLAKIGHWNWDITGARLEWSDEVYRIFGTERTSSEPTYEAFLNFVHPDDRGTVVRAVEEALEGGEYDLLHRIVLTDGTERIVHEVARVEFAADGKPLRMFGTVQDITGQIRVEGKLNRFSRVLEQSPLWVVISDPEGKVTYANEAVVRLTGYAREEILEGGPSLFKSGEHDNAFYEHLWETITSGNVWRSQVINRTAGGRRLVLDMTISSLRDAQGRITDYVSTAKDITQQTVMEERLDRLAFVDELTGLPNRRSFIRHLEGLKVGRSSQAAAGALMVVDIDRFKLLNESAGYDAGDMALRQVAVRMVSVVEGRGLVARLGTDDFGIAVSGKTPDETALILGRELAAAMLEPLVVGDQELVVTLSIGIALCVDEEFDPEASMEKAYSALAAARKRGSNQHSFYHDQADGERGAFLETQAALVSALKNREFVLHYQPYFDLGNGALAGMEALIRWERPGEGLVPPYKFIPVLEETGLIAGVGDWTIDEACRQLAEWKAKGLTVVPVAVNLSSLQFRQENLPSRVQTILERHGVAPGLLTMEITETAMMDDLNTARSIVARFRELGLRVSIDDFGTGHSSLAYLSRLPVHHLKIDMAFVRPMLESPDNATLVRAMIQMAQALGMKTIAEGVETEKHWNMLRLLRCDIAQGFLRSPGVPAVEVEEFFEA